MTDPIALVRELRPDDADVRGAWPAGERAAVLDDILATRRRSRRPVLIGIAGIAAASAAALTIALVQPAGGPPSGHRAPALPHAQLAAVTTALHHLAGVAAAGPADVGDGRFWHLRIREQQNGPEGQRNSVTSLESWTDHTGRMWRHDVLTLEGTAPQQDYYEFPAGDDQVNYPSPAYLDSLPTDPDALYSTLDAQVSGSATHEEAIFVAVGDMLRADSHLPRCAALRSRC